MTDEAGTNVASVALEALGHDAAELGEAAEFLYQHMNNAFSAAEWLAGLQACWLPDAPNHGFVLRSDGGIVGILCATYSEQTIHGQLERFCNPHSWCVLEPYRKRSVDLVLAVIRQPGFHYTMFSPNADGLQIFGFLKFKPIDNSMVILPHLPWPGLSSRLQVLSDEQAIAAALPPVAAKCFDDHKGLPNLQTLAFGQGENFALLIYKQERYKRMRSANIIHVSDPALFERIWAKLRSHLLLRRGLKVSRIERRLLAKPPRPAFPGLPGQQKLFLSPNLAASDIQNTYSELVALNL